MIFENRLDKIPIILRIKDASITVATNPFWLKINVPNSSNRPFSFNFPFSKSELGTIKSAIP